LKWALVRTGCKPQVKYIKIGKVGLYSNTHLSSN